jgi:hypothetical protein
MGIWMGGCRLQFTRLASYGWDNVLLAVLCYELHCVMRALITVRKTNVNGNGNANWGGCRVLALHEYGWVLLCYS